MFKEINKLKIQGANFIKETLLEIFSSENNKITLIYGKNGTGKSTIARGINKISG
ncbi:Phosphate transport ATP-binding protein pstB [Fusobacterium vincentii ATCC 49256]|nr:Phosphate transport ATP-binding protein pstB [Fusobacterium vincentii ATCC 49256]